MFFNKNDGHRSFDTYKKITGDELLAYVKSVRAKYMEDSWGALIFFTGMFLAVLYFFAVKEFQLKFIIADIVGYFFLTGIFFYMPLIKYNKLVNKALLHEFTLLNAVVSDLSIVESPSGRTIKYVYYVQVDIVDEDSIMSSYRIKILKKQYKSLYKGKPVMLIRWKDIMGFSNSAYDLYDYMQIKNPNVDISVYKQAKKIVMLHRVYYFLTKFIPSLFIICVLLIICMWLLRSNTYLFLLVSIPVSILVERYQAKKLKGPDMSELPYQIKINNYRLIKARVSCINKAKLFSKNKNIITVEELDETNNVISSSIYHIEVNSLEAMRYKSGQSINVIEWKDSSSIVYTIYES